MPRVPELAREAIDAWTTLDGLRCPDPNGGMARLRVADVVAHLDEVIGRSSPTRRSLAYHLVLVIESEWVAFEIERSR